MTNIPKCQVPGCCENAQNTKTKVNPYYRKASWVREEFNVEEGYVCGKHHTQKIADNHGVASIYFVSPNESLQKALDAGYSTGMEYQAALYEVRMKEAGCDNREEYAHHLLKERNYSSYDAITKMKCTGYYTIDIKQNKWNSYNSKHEMTDDLIDLVHENMKRNNGEVRCEVTNVVLSHELKDIFQISFDRKDNTIGHDRSNIRIVLEPVNTWIKDKFTINDLQGFLDAVFEEREKAA